MPSYLLQVQLEILVEELAAAIPEKRASYEKLLQAATELRESRRRHLAEDRVQSLSAAFDRAVGPEWSEKYRHTGYVLASAVADELAGYEGTVEHIRDWLSDPSRCPTEWIAAVRETLAQAKAI